MEYDHRYNSRRTHGGVVFKSNAGVLPGLVLVAVGAIFFLNNLHIFYLRDIFRFWPAILIAAGIVKLVDSSMAPDGFAAQFWQAWAECFWHAILDTSTSPCGKSGRCS